MEARGMITTIASAELESLDTLQTSRCQLVVETATM